ncbi:MAG: polyketide cyclase, partial [Bradyrhizobium sp.]
MLEIIAIVAIVLAIAIVIILALALTKPDTLSVQRSAVVQAPADRIFPLVNNFHEWVSWSPWENRDPAMKRSYSGAESGKGAVYA